MLVWVKKNKTMKKLLNATVVFCFGVFIIPNCWADPVIVWGNNTYGQTNVPISATNVIALAAGDAHCLALRADGRVIAWGGSWNFGETNVPLDLTNAVSISAGSAHSLALRRNGTVVLWGKLPPVGNPLFGVVPADATNIVGLALGPGAQHGLILRSDGTVEDWGLAAYGLTNIPPIARNAVAVAVGSYHSLVLRSDGRLVAWGDNSHNQTNIPTAATNIVAIAAGWYGNAALRSDGAVVVWGSTLSPTTSFTNVVDLVCPFSGNGNSDILALRGNGTMVEYSSGVPAYPTNQVAAISAGGNNGLYLIGSGAPIFSGIPANRTVATGSRAYFRGLAVGTMPMSYQWTCNGTNLSGATNTVLTLTNVQPEQAGNFYSLIASNALGTATNGAMFLNELAVDFAIQPQTLSVFAGASAKFTTAYTNGVGPLSFQWQFANTNLSGATNSSLSLSNVQLNQAGVYALIASNSYGSATNTVTLTVTPLTFRTGSTNLIMTTNGLQFRLDSVYATNAVFIFASTDLVSWLPIYTNPPATGSVMFLDAGATNTPQRFYRAMEQ